MENDNENSEEVKRINKEKQDTRAFLRERFLRCISRLNGTPCQMKTVELTEVSGTYQSMDLHVTEMFIKNLSTPCGTINNSLVRTADLLYIKFPQVDRK